MKTVSLESHIRRLALGWTVAGILLTLAFSGGVFHWLTYQAAENQIVTLAKSALASYRTDILSGGIRSIELQLRKDFSISENENLFFLDVKKTPWVGDLRITEFRHCSAPSGICRDFWNRKIVIEKPIYFDDEGKSLWGYLHIEKKPHTDRTLVLSVTLAIIFGMLFQNLGFYFNLHKAIKSVSATIGNWANRLSANPKDAMNYESAPFEEIAPIGLALAGLRNEIDALENLARQQGALATLRGVGHDILNPVSRMKRILGLLSLRSSNGPSSEELITNLNLNLKRLSCYAGHLKYIYKKQSGEHVETTPILNLSTEVGALAKELHFDSEAQDKNITVVADVAAGCYARIPAPEFGRIIENLCGNSIQASGPNSTVAVKVEPIGNTVQIIVEDFGGGIQLDHQKKIFEPGFTTKTNKGTGLGLFVVKQICEQYGGEISLDSKMGRGTRINIAFPKIEVQHGI